MQSKKLLIVCLSLCAILLFVGLMPVHGEEEIYNTVVRLHVLANSDSKEDQALKLQVRDAVLDLSHDWLKDCTTQEEAIAVLNAHEGELQACAEKTLRQAGCADAVTVLLGKESYPRKDYESACFPQGEYVSLRICIGKAEGQNWWCCLFPPLCLGAAQPDDGSNEDAFIQVGLTPSQYKIITESEKPVYRVRFRILELFSGIK